LILGGSRGDVCTGNKFWGCKREGTATHPINPIQSARLRSSRGFTMKYGKVEVEAKMPKGEWIWPGIKFNLTREQKMSSCVSLLCSNWLLSNICLYHSAKMANSNCPSWLNLKYKTITVI